MAQHHRRYRQCQVLRSRRLRRHEHTAPLRSDQAASRRRDKKIRIMPMEWHFLAPRRRQECLDRVHRPGRVPRNRPRPNPRATAPCGLGRSDQAAGARSAGPSRAPPTDPASPCCQTAEELPRGAGPSARRPLRPSGSRRSGRRIGIRAARPTSIGDTALVAAITADLPMAPRAIASDHVYGIARAHRGSSAGAGAR